MNAEQLVEAGNQARSSNNPGQALLYYAQAFTQDPDNFSAWKVLYYLPKSTENERTLALQNMKRLDPLNKNLEQLK